MRKDWSKEELDWFIENYPKVGLNKCAEKLNRSAGSILHKASHLGLRRRGAGRADRYHIYDGYIYVSTVNERYALHRRIMEESIGRKLTEDEVVHHKNGNRMDNRIENLELTTRAEHQGVLHKQDLENRRDAKTGRFKGY